MLEPSQESEKRAAATVRQIMTQQAGPSTTAARHDRGFMDTEKSWVTSLMLVRIVWLCVDRGRRAPLQKAVQSAGSRQKNTSTSPVARTSQPPPRSAGWLRGLLHRTSSAAGQDVHHDVHHVHQETLTDC